MAIRQFIVILICNILLVHFASSQDSPSDWTYTLEAAEQQASIDGKDILMVFAGSDWCRPCIQFKNEILMQEEFQAFAADNLVILYLDFPAKKKNQLSIEQRQHNEALAEKYNASGAFPKLVLINISEGMNHAVGYTNQSAAEFVNQIKRR